MKNFTEVFLIPFLEKHNIKYSIDNNPSIEKIERIKASIKRRKKQLNYLKID